MTARRVMKARGQSTCPMCQRTINRGQQIGLTPVGWAHTRCIIKAAQALTTTNRPGMVRLTPRPPRRTGGAEQEGTTA